MLRCICARSNLLKSYLNYLLIGSRRFDFFLLLLHPSPLLSLFLFLSHKRAHSPLLFSHADTIALELLLFLFHSNNNFRLLFLLLLFIFLYTCVVVVVFFFVILAQIKIFVYVLEHSIRIQSRYDLQSPFNCSLCADFRICSCTTIRSYEIILDSILLMYV